ncbi:MFS transporter [Salinarimonas soli]|nr:MFS transporter [Salinarimonas soli]
MLAVLFGARTALGFQFQTIASAAPFLTDRLGIGFAEIGTLIGLYTLPGVLLAFPGGLLVRRFGDKPLCCTGLGLMVLGGAVMGLGEGYASLLAGRLISGIGGVFLGLAVTKMTTDWFAEKGMVTAMSILLTSWPLGIAAGLLAYAPLAQAQGWPWVMYLSAAACLIALALIAAFYRAPPASSSPQLAPASGLPKPSMFALPPREQMRPVIVAGFAWGTFNLALLAYFSFVPQFLAEHGFGLAEAAFATSLVLWVMIVSMPLGGHRLQQSGRPDTGVMLFSVAAGLVMVGLPFAPAAAIVFALIIGCLLGPPPGALLAMPGRVLRPETRAVGFGVFMTVYNLVMVAGPMLLGALRNQFGAVAPVLVGPALFMSVAPLTLLFRRLQPSPAETSLSK